jgi:hypothetical protein
MDKQKGALARLQNALYSRGARNKAVRETKRHSLHDRYYGVAKEWQKDPEEEELPPSRPSKQRSSALSFFLLASVVFFVISVGAAIALFFSGSSTVSNDNIDIAISGPIAIPGGKELSLQITIKNRNPVALELADMLVEYPDGTRSAVDAREPLLRLREPLGTIEPGQEVRKTIRASLFGQENDTKDIAVTIEYRIEGSNAIFFKEEGYRVIISSAPLTLLVDAPDELVSGQDITVTVDVVSNSTSLIQDVLLIAEYPFGFELTSSNPPATFDTSVWRLGDIPPEGKRTVKLQGRFIGQDGEERVIRFRAGVAKGSEERDITAELGTYTAEFSIKQPFISLDVALDGSTEEVRIVRAGDQVRGDIAWVNNLPTQVFDAEIAIKFSGDALDKEEVRVSKGFYDSVANTIRFTKETMDDLATLSPGTRDRASFSFKTHDISSGISFEEPEILLSISVSGRRVSETNVPEAIESTETRRVQLATDLLLSSRAVYTTGPFTNTGPLPPKAEEETTYTIIWSLTNSSNSVTGAKVVATLPSFVRWVGVVDTPLESVSFNPVGGILTWSVGDVAAHTGYQTSPREVAFQIALVPSISQVGKTPTLIGEQTLSGTDRFTKIQVGGVGKALTARLLTDPNVDNKHDRVVQ